MIVSGLSTIDVDRQLRQVAACPQKRCPKRRLQPLDRALENLELVPKCNLHLKKRTAAKTNLASLPKWPISRSWVGKRKCSTLNVSSRSEFSRRTIHGELKMIGIQISERTVS